MDQGEKTLTLIPQDQPQKPEELRVACPERRLQKTTFYHQDQSEPLRMHPFFSYLLAEVVLEGC